MAQEPNGEAPARARSPILFVALGVVLAGTLLAVAAGRLDPVTGAVVAGAAGLVLAWRGAVAFRIAEQVRHRSVATRKVFEASESVLSSLDVGHVLRTAAETGARLSWHAGAALLFLADDVQQLRLRSSWGLDPAPAEGARILALEPIIAEAARTRRVALTAVRGSQPARDDPSATFRSACALPLQSEAGMVGVLVLLSQKPPEAFREELSLLEYYARQAAMAIDNARLYQQVKDLFESSIRSLADAVDAKDAYTHGHSEDLADLVTMIAREMRLPPREEEKIRWAGLLHDVGKIGIPDAILRKPGKLDPAERAIMMTHATLGAAILDKPGPLQDLVGIVRHHHEWFDGRGYPDGLRGNQIPIGAAILTAADAFDAMTSHRAYHTARGVDVALTELRTHAGTQFNPDVVNALTRVIQRERAAQTPWYATLERRIANPAGGQAPAQEAAMTLTEADLVLRVAQEIRDIGDFSRLLQRTVEVAADIVRTPDCALWLINGQADTMIAEAAVGTSVTVGTETSRTRTPMWRALEQKAAQRDDGGGVIFVPLLTAGKAIGVLQATGSNLGDSEARRLSLVADSIAPVVQAARLRQQAERDARIDAVTGLLSRRSFSDALREQALRHRQWGRPLALTLGEVHDLSLFNATYGYAAGNDLLKRIAELVRDASDGAHILGRVGGGVFAILMPETDKTSADRTLRGLQETMAGREVAIKGQFMPVLPMRWTLATAPPDSNEGDALLGVAERRLLRAAELPERPI
ncbi:MAG TPA: HD domain-containing phosphohydrolase [bacterium]|nr:HD domain-containing phosphohydrolase [bacterium]